MSEQRFRAMGSDAHIIIVGGPDGLVDVAQARVAELEQRWSRFIEASEVNELNRGAGRAVAVSSDTVLLVERAIEAWRITGGSFDPTVLGAMLRSGYDTTFTSIAPDRSVDAVAPSALVVGCTDIVVAGNTARLPAGSGFDAGGIGKGLAADIVAGELMAAGAEGVCINLGGDLRVVGRSPEGDGWTIAVEHPWSDEPVVLVGVGAGAVCTSTTLKRTWRVDGETRHHLIDPFTGEPSESDLNLVSVICGEAWMGEVLAKAMLLRGSERAFDIIDTNVVQAITVDGSGALRATPGLRAYLGSHELPAVVTKSLIPNALEDF